MRGALEKPEPAEPPLADAEEEEEASGHRVATTTPKTVCNGPKPSTRAREAMSLLTFVVRYRYEKTRF